MNPSQLEALVMAAVAQVQGGLSPEDDRIEFKRDWPGPDKVRQLAAAANKADGHNLIYVIGVDEKSGQIAKPKHVDPASWWAQLESQFDEVAPELERHLQISVTQTESVTALLFRTDRSPYVVKVANGGPTEREVPIRVGTRTRSAHRHELLRLLHPTVHVPRLDAVDGLLTLSHPDYYGGDSERVVHLTLRSQLFFEHLQPQPAFLPRHLSHASIVSPKDFDAATIHYGSDQSFAPAGVSRRQDGLELFGSGVAAISAVWSFDQHRRGELSRHEEWSIRVSFAVTGTDRMATFEYRFHDRFEEIEARRGHLDAQMQYGWKMG